MPIMNVETGAIVHDDPELVKIHPTKFKVISEEEAAQILASRAASASMVPPAAMTMPHAGEVQMAADELMDAMGPAPGKKGKAKGRK